MQVFTSKLFKAITRHVLGHTLYDMMRSSCDFEDVKAALNDRIDWSIELFRSSFTICLGDGGYFFMLSALSFLVMAESIHIHCGRLSPAKLKELTEQVGYEMFALLLAVLDLGFVVVRIAGLVALSRSPVLAAALVLASLSPSVILPVLTYLARLLVQRKRGHDEDVEAKSSTVVDEVRN